MDKKSKSILVAIFGIILTSSIYWMPRILCQSDDLSCRLSFSAIGLFATAIGAIVLAKGLKGVFGDKKLF